MDIHALICYGFSIQGKTLNAPSSSDSSEVKYPMKREIGNMSENSPCSFILQKPLTARTVIEFCCNIVLLKFHQRIQVLTVFGQIYMKQIFNVHFVNKLEKNYFSLFLGPHIMPKLRQ